MSTHPMPGVLMLPNGSEPFPMIIVLHGCSGLSPSQEAWGAHLNTWGYAALIPDSFGQRGVGYNCAGDVEQRPVTRQDRVGDVISAALWLRTQPQIDPARIGVIGFYNGGWTANWVTERRYARLYPSLIKAAVNYNSGCVHPADHGALPLLVLAEEADDWGFPAQMCCEFGAKLASGQVFQIHTYPGAVHCFDRHRARRIASRSVRPARQPCTALPKHRYVRGRVKTGGEGMSEQLESRGLLTERTAGAQCRRHELVLMPHNRR